MPEPAANGASSGPGSGSISGDLSELRQLLVGPELEQLAGVEQRLSDPGRRSADLAEILPKALPDAVKAARQKALSEALAPLFEKSFQLSVRKNPRELADVIYPIIGPAIRTSITAAIRDFAEALNQIVEKSASFRAIKWRVESIITGNPFSEILLARSLLYAVEQVFLIHRKSGLMLIHVASSEAVVKDADMVSGMLTAIQDFLSDSFASAGQDLETVDAGKFKLWLTYGPAVLLVGAVSGTAPVELRQVFRRALDQVESELSVPLASGKTDDLGVFEPARPVLEKCLLGQSAPDKRPPARLWPYLLVGALLVVGLIVFEVRKGMEWDRYFAALQQQSGLLVTGIEKRSFWFRPSTYLVSGLKDPLAPNPPLPAGREAQVRFALRPYLSLDGPFAAQREQQAARERIENTIIRFDVGSSKLPLGVSDQIDIVSASMKQLLKVRPGTHIRVTGRTDEIGSPASNSKLSFDRAKAVIDAVVAEGVPPGALETLGVGNSQPLRTGGTDWDRVTNRSTSFTVIP